jgi:ketosteroid isomerase-like protein
MDKHGRFVAVVFLGCCISLAVQAQEAEREADHNALRALMAKAKKAINEQDLDTLETCFTKEFAFTTADQSLITDRATLRAHYNRIFKSPDSIVVDLHSDPKAEILTRFTGPDTGYCYGHAVETYNIRNKRIFKIMNRWTALLRKEDGEWRMEAAHVGVNFIDNPVLEARSMGFWRKVGVALRLVDPPWERVK